ncbi:hypothetical protein ACFL1H_04340 [Nanoarchaeota archaeon]
MEKLGLDLLIPVSQKEEDLREHIKQKIINFKDVIDGDKFTKDDKYFISKDELMEICDGNENVANVFRLAKKYHDTTGEVRTCGNPYFIHSYRAFLIAKDLTTIIDPKSGRIVEHPFREGILCVDLLHDVLENCVINPKKLLNELVNCGISYPQEIYNFTEKLTNPHHGKSLIPKKEYQHYHDYMDIIYDDLVMRYGLDKNSLDYKMHDVGVIAKNVDRIDNVQTTLQFRLQFEPKDPKRPLKIITKTEYMVEKQIEMFEKLNTKNLFLLNACHMLIEYSIFEVYRNMEYLESKISYVHEHLNERKVFGYYDLRKDYNLSIKDAVNEMKKWTEKVNIYNELKLRCCNILNDKKNQFFSDICSM